MRGERRKISIEEFIWPEFPFPVPLLDFPSRTFSYNDVEVLEQWWLSPRAFNAADTIPMFCYQWIRDGVNYRLYTSDLPLAEARGVVLSMLLVPLY